MRLLLQKNIWQENDYDRFIGSLENARVAFEEVHVVPFTDAFDSEVRFVPDYVFGSGRFVNICRTKGYPTFPSFAPIEPLLFDQKHWINGSGTEARWGELNITEPVFVKPFTEKFFTGRVVESNEDKEKVQLATSFIEEEKNELVWVSEPVRLTMEVRFFVLNGEIISGSIYRHGGMVHHVKVMPTHDSWLACKRILNTGRDLPQGFVIDLGCVFEGKYVWKIVEMNNLNSAGLYKCDTDAIVRALQILSK